MRVSKRQKHCEGCQQDEGARFRALVDLYLCMTCYGAWLKTGAVPAPQLEELEEERRW